MKSPSPDFSEKRLPVIYIFGSTASGKTRLSIDIWKYLDQKKIKAEIINCDSIQLYKGFDIGTAKVSKEIRKTIPHHLIDIFDIDEECTASKYVKLAVPIIENLLDNNKIPIIVGGTHMYLKALIWKSIIDFSLDLEFNPSLSNEKYSNFTCEELYQELMKIDPKRAFSLHKNDRRRIIASIEIFKKFGMSFTELVQKYPYSPRYDNNLLFWVRNLQIKHYINIRIEEMMKEGLLQEAFLLKEKIINSSKFTGILQGIAFKEFKNILEKKSEIKDVTPEELKESIENLRRKTLQYSKRQENYIKKHLITDNLKVNILIFNGEKNEINEIDLKKSGFVDNSINLNNEFELSNKYDSNKKIENSLNHLEAEISWKTSVLNQAFNIIDEYLFTNG